jgi:hypothetical protein
VQVNRKVLGELSPTGTNKLSPGRQSWGQSIRN